MDGLQTSDSREHAAGRQGGQGRRASGAPRQPRSPSQAVARSRRASRASHPVTRTGEPGREQATFPRCDGSAAQAPVSVLVATYSTWNPQPNLQPLHCLERARPDGALEPKLPRLLSPWFAPSFHPPIQPAITVTTPRRIGTGQTGRDRARWSGPGPVSDHAPVRKR